MRRYCFGCGEVKAFKASGDVNDPDFSCEDCGRPLGSPEALDEQQD